MAATPIGTPVLDDCDAGRADGVFTATLTWTLKTQLSDSLEDMLSTNVAAAFADYLPFEGNVFPGVPLATCRGVRCKNTDTKGFYTYTASYSDANSDGEEKGTDDNPLNDRPIIKPTAGMTSRAITRDRDNYAILNAVGDPVLQSMEDNTIGLRISANVESLPQWVLSLRNTCNESQITVGGLTVPANGARFILPSDFLSDVKNRNDINYRVFTFELLFDERDLHYGRPLNAGFRKIAETRAGFAEPVNITNKDGSEISEPVPLDENGNVIEDPTPENAYFLTVKKYPEAQYNVLPGVN